MALLKEIQPFQYNVIESKKKPGVLMTLEGVFQRANTKNANKRIYPESLWKKLIGDKELNERIASRGMVGECDHPASGSSSMSRISHVITEQKLMPNGEVRGTLEILPTPMGKIAAALFEADIKIGISSRGDGTVEQKGDFSEVQDDFKLETYDLVLKPSTPGAYPQVVESEEEAEQNKQLIVNAVEGLVKRTKDIKVLLECHKIINALEGCNSRTQEVLSTLESKLSLAKDESSNSTNNGTQTHIEETNMSNETNSPQDLLKSPELAAFLKEQVALGIAEEKKDLESKIHDLNQKVLDITSQKEATDKELSAAKEVAEELKRKAEDLQESGTQEDYYKEHYEGSLQLLEEVFSRVQDEKIMTRRQQAAEGLVAAALKHFKESAVYNKVESTLSGMDEAIAEKIRPLLEGCDTPAEVDAEYNKLASLIESVTPQNQPVVEAREPLPTPQVLTETTQSLRGTSVKEPASVSDYTLGKLLKRVG